MAARGLIIAAPASGAGKTTVTLGLIAALHQSGQAVAPFKVGPDYIDPGYLSAAAGGRTCPNLDPWAQRPATLAALVAGVGGDEIAVVEGVMGLHDGPGSTAALARLTGWPIVLVIDAAKSAQTAAAVADGLILRDPDLVFAGIIFNRVASPRHQAMIAGGLRSNIPVAYLPTQPDLSLPSRHLGLQEARERQDLHDFLNRAAIWAQPCQALVDQAQATRLTEAVPARLQKSPGLEHLGLSFAYPHLEIPKGALFLPGGYPELYLQALKQDPKFLPDLRQAAAAGILIYGECGGFMVLGQALIDAQGRRHEMAGLLPLVTTFAEPQRHLGYRQIQVLSDFALGSAGQNWRGHEFHYTQIAWQGAAAPLFHCRDAQGRDLGPQGMKLGSVAGSYLHLIDQSA